MALWYNCGGGAVELKKSFAKRSLNLDVYLCCTGPSLANIESSTLRKRGVFTIGLNTSYPHITPNMWIGMDRPQCFHENLWFEPFMKICRAGFFKEKLCGHKINEFPNTLFADVKEYDDDEQIFKQRSHETKFFWKNNSLVVALHIAVWMGADKIHLLGCDLGGSRDYFDDRVLTGKQREHNKRLYNSQINYLKWFYEVGKKYNVNLISCTENSPINSKVPYISLDEALWLTESRIPKINNKIVHSLEAFKNE